MMRSVLYAAALTMVVLPRVASCQETDAPSVAVSFRGLDLTKVDDRNRFQIRLNTAVSRLCAVDGRVDLSISMQRKTCLRTARASASTAFDTAIASVGGRSNTQIASR